MYHKFVWEYRRLEYGVWGKHFSLSFRSLHAISVDFQSCWIVDLSFPVL
jgi:hypothetical protein